MRNLASKRLLGTVRAYRPPPGMVAFATTGDNTAELTVAAAPFTLTITEPADYQGVYSVNPAPLGGGPSAITPPRIPGPVQAGQSAGIVPALWAYLATGGLPSVTWQWQRDGVDIVGATEDRITPDAMDVGRMLRVIETATDAGGTRISISQPVTIAA